VIVVGAGPIGLMTAWRAARAGAQVRLLDDGGTPAGHVAAGMLGPWSEAEHRDGAMHDLMVAAARRWPDVARELAEDSGHDVGFTASGTLLVACRPEHMAPLRRHGEVVKGLDDPLEWRTGGELRALEPGLGTAVAGGYALKHEHQVDPRRLMAALRAANAARGVHSETGGARRLVERDDAIVGVETRDGTRFTARTTVVAAGWEASQLAEGVPLRPVKGQILRLFGEDPPVTRVVRSADAYVAPRPSGEVVVGGTVEERGDRRVIAGAVSRLLEDAIALVPDLRELELREVAAGLRPATPDGLPAIGADRRAGLIWAAGAFRHGILLSPVIAEAAGGLAAGHDPLPGMAPFSPRRFREAA
jgi:glycine oxidase